MNRSGKTFIRALILGLVLSVPAVIVSCAEEAVPEEPRVEPLSAGEIDGERLWQRIVEDAPFETYSYWPEQEGLQPGQAPHGSFHSIFVNRVLFEALPIPDRVAPEGSIIVKESYDANQELAAYTVMAKVDGIAPEHGDWFWAMYSPEGLVRNAGVLESCIACHAGMSSNDYVIVHPLDENPSEAR